MATGANKPAASSAAASVWQQQQQQQQQKQALFAAKYAELVSEARGVAREFGVDVRTLAFRPAGAGAVAHEFRGVQREARALGAIRRAVARDVSAMGPEEAARHEAQLRALRAVVVRELQEKTKKAAAAAAGGGKVKGAPDQQETVAAGGSNKIR